MASVGGIEPPASGFGDHRTPRAHRHGAYRRSRTCWFLSEHGFTDRLALRDRGTHAMKLFADKKKRPDHIDQAFPGNRGDELTNPLTGMRLVHVGISIGPEKD